MKNCSKMMKDRNNKILRYKIKFRYNQIKYKYWPMRIKWLKKFKIKAMRASKLNRYHY